MDTRTHTVYTQTCSLLPRDFYILTSPHSCTFVTHAHFPALMLIVSQRLCATSQCDDMLCLHLEGFRVNLRNELAQTCSYSCPCSHGDHCFKDICFEQTFLSRHSYCSLTELWIFNIWSHDVTIFVIDNWIKSKKICMYI